MSIVFDICLGVFGTWAFKNLKQAKKTDKAVVSILSIVLILLLVVQHLEDSIVSNAVIVGLAFVISFVFYSRMAVLHEKIFNKLSYRSAISEDEEDFMKTRLGKVLLVTCILLVIYMIISSVCIYKLNSKINSVYNITQELSEGK